MAAVYKLTNISGADGEFGGQDIADGETYVVANSELEQLRHDTDIMVAVATQQLQVSNDTTIFTDPVDGWNYFEGDTLPKSTIDGKKLSVHTSYKPEIDGVDTYAVWTGAGDDIADDVNGNGNGTLLCIETEVGTPVTNTDVHFNPIYGRVWIHEGYLKFDNGGRGDTITSTVLSNPVPLQQVAQLDLVVEDNWIKFSSGGPGTGTHGFADPTKIVLVDRTFSADGDWNYDTVNGLTPNFAGDGSYKISDIEQVVHRYINRIPCYGSCSTYFSMSSDETTELRPGYFVRITANNASDTVWHASVLMEIYREQTYSP